MDEVFVRSKNIFDPPKIAKAMARERKARLEEDSLGRSSDVKSEGKADVDHIE